MSILDEDFDQRIDWAMQRAHTKDFLFPSTASMGYQGQCVRLTEIIEDPDYDHNYHTENLYYRTRRRKMLANTLLGLVRVKLPFNDTNACIVKLSGELTNNNFISCKTVNLGTASEMFGVPIDSINRSIIHSGCVNIFTVELWVHGKKALVDCLILDDPYIANVSMSCLISAGPIDPLMSFNEE